MDQKCGFDEKKPCTRKCIYFDTCTWNPSKKKGKGKPVGMVYENIVQTVNFAIHEFTRQIGVQPNRLIMGKDVVDYLVEYTDKCITICKKTDAPSTMFGMDIEVVYGKPGLIEVGYVTHTPYRVNVNYEEEKKPES